MILGTFILFIALGLSAIAAYYSIVGLAAIFAAAVVPIIVMAGALETAKIATTIWLHQHWKECKFIMKAYLTMAVIVLMFITSLGIFGFLSKAHVEQSITAGDNTVMLAEVDRRVEIERKRITDAELVIAQLDQAVQVLMDAQRIRGTEGAIAVRQSQLTEREGLNAIIDSANEAIMELQHRRVPLLQDQLTIEAKVGPLKYIAAMVYGSNLNEDMLEEAVRWVIILLVAVFDPLAIMMVLAGVESFSWAKRKKEALTEENQETDSVDPQVLEDAQKWRDELAFREEVARQEKKREEDQTRQIQQIATNLAKAQEPLPPDMADILYNNIEDLYEETPFTPVLDDDIVEDQTPLAPPTEDPTEEETPKYFDLGVTLPYSGRDYAYFPPTDVLADPTEILSTTVEMHPISEHYFQIGNKKYHQRVVNTVFPDLKASVDDIRRDDVGFGTAFPSAATRGQMFLRVDYVPTRLFKFNGVKWIAVDKKHSSRYVTNQEYIKMLISKIGSGEYDPDLLNDDEREQIESVLRESGIGS